MLSRLPINGVRMVSRHMLRSASIRYPNIAFVQNRQYSDASKDKVVASYLPDIDQEPSKATDYLSLLVFEITKCDLRVQAIEMPRYNLKYRHETADLSKEYATVSKPISDDLKTKYSHHVPIVNLLIKAIDRQYQHTKAAKPEQTHETAMSDAVDMFTRAIKEQINNVDKKKDDVERKLLSYIYFLRGRLLLDAKIDLTGAEADFIRSVQLGDDVTPNTPFRSWHAVVGLGNLYHQRAIMISELYTNDVYIEQPTSEAHGYDLIERDAKKFALYMRQPELPDKDAEEATEQEIKETLKIPIFQQRLCLNVELFKTRMDLPRETDGYRGESIITVNGERVVKPHPPNQLELYALRQKALNFFTEAIKMNDKFTEAMIERGWFHANLGKYFNEDYFDRALVDLNRAIEFEDRLTKRSFYPYFVRGLVYIHRKEYKQATVDLTSAIKLCSRHPELYMYRALAYLKLKKYRLHYNDKLESLKLHMKLRKDVSRERLMNRRYEIERLTGKPTKQKRRVVTVVKKVVNKVTGETVRVQKK
ncbi:hypothetical protein AKO1_011554 [Acrasis kona]|uniref:Uncharacterized protein n=1 Tax=Acrasis kona TaxID=1008807 RepID=A0AAW2Z3L9_9EUKA